MTAATAPARKRQRAKGKPKAATPPPEGLSWHCGGGLGGCKDQHGTYCPDRWTDAATALVAAEQTFPFLDRSHMAFGGWYDGQHDGESVTLFVWHVVRYERGPDADFDLYLDANGARLWKRVRRINNETGCALTAATFQPLSPAQALATVTAFNEEARRRFEDGVGQCHYCSVATTRPVLQADLAELPGVFVVGQYCCRLCAVLCWTEQPDITNCPSAFDVALRLRDAGCPHRDLSDQQQIQFPPLPSDRDIAQAIVEWSESLRDMALTNSSRLDTMDGVSAFESGPIGKGGFTTGDGWHSWQEIPHESEGFWLDLPNPRVDPTCTYTFMGLDPALAELVAEIRNGERGAAS